MQTQNITGAQAQKRAKLKHVQACLLPASQYQKSAGFDAIELMHQPAAGLSLNDINLATEFLGHRFSAPLMIAPMTGGTELGHLLNQRWARAAHYFGLPFGVGSQRLALKSPEVSETFKVRVHAPSIFLFANLGAAQILHEEGPQDAVKAVEMIDANALFIHLNPLQEACQKNGDHDFRGLVSAIARVYEVLHKKGIKVLVREVGFGLSKEAAALLLSTGIDGLDCSGAGGTSWAKVEGLCADDESYQRLAQTFGEWGIPTAQSILNVRHVHKTLPLIASGGIRSGLDVAKALALGANMASMAQPMLKAAVLGESQLFSFIEQILQELRVAMFAHGAKVINQLPFK